MASTTTITKSATETKEVGRSMGNTITSPRLICLHGDLGSGKTTFVQGFAEGLGITQRLLSPTFIIVRRYQIPNSTGFLYHFDLYRVQHVQDVLDVGLDEFFSDPDSIVIIEWAEKIQEHLSNTRTDIYFTEEKNGTHSITVV